MDHVGPPRFVSVGDTVELAPWDPDPAASYRWSLERAPADAAVTLTDRPVQQVDVETPGTYVFALDAPSGTHHQTVRCFSASGERGTRAPPGASGGARDAPGDGDAGYPHAERGDARGRPRVRLDGHREGDEVVLTATPRAHPESAESAADLDVVFALDDRDALSADATTVEGRELRVPVSELDGRERVHAVAVGESGHSVADAVAITRDGDAVSVERRYDAPDWAADAAYYEVYVRTFAPDAAHGETLDAITERLDHLADLGVDAVWLTPVLANDDAPHGYNITDFFAIAPDLGERADYERLVEEAHARDMKVLFDLVLNHTGREHPFFRDAYENPESPYRDWYDWQESGEPETYFDWELIANLDYGTLDVRRHLLDAVDEWAPLVDGFRCDMAWAVPDGFWREVRARVKDHDSEFLLLDETIPYIPNFHEGMFDVHFDSTTYASLRSVGRGDAPAPAVLDAVESRRESGFPDHARFLLYMENHDETRYRVECGRPASLAAAGVLCTLPGAPLVYAGQELGQLGRRDAVVWDPEHTDDALLAHYRRLLGMRREMPALAAGGDLRRLDYEVVEGDDERVVAYGRVAPDATASGSDGDPRDADAAVVLCNFAEGSATVSLDVDAAAVDAVTGDALGGDAVTVDDVVVLPTTPDALAARAAPPGERL
ncbi:alpha-amylase (plasmid) [Halarchaeum sp. CBA1220]|uniref:alpha-amylase MalA n=1 Tax=Halarchaeum sp. CBA1220 TaxID=1853682 RepID=UPI000F3A9033|nr:alpha-amylase MalA [Halarchaeum sp. CBA1220]QLC34966.1 alpha-amylase [Halarchaeum sp. CBA1220]